MTDRSAWKKYRGGLAWPTLVLFVVLTLGHLATWWLILAFDVPLAIGFGLQVVHAYLAFTPLHEAVHGNIGGRAERSWIDTAIGWVCASLLLAPYPAFRVLHLTHHAHTNDPHRDPDHWVAGSGAFSVVLRCVSIVPRYLVDYFTGRTSQLQSARRSRRASIAYFALQGAAIAVAIAMGYGMTVLCLFVLPAIVASGLLAFAFDWMPHHPHDVQGRYVDTRVVLFWGLGILTLGQSYHTVHHLYPRIPFYRYGTCFHAIRDELEARGAPILDLRWGGRARSGR